MSETGIQDISQNTTHNSPVQNGSSATESVTPETITSAPTKAAPNSNGASHDGTAAEAEDGDAEVAATLASSEEEEDALDDSATSDEEATTEDSEDGSDEDSAQESEAALEIDQRRAKQLLDRAILLSERGDLAGAILASRQAVALAPNEPSGHSMLGLLHERAGDLEKAIAAYEKVVQLAPHNALERDSLGRLKATLESENSSVLFHFDDNELFEEPETLAPPLPEFSVPELSVETPAKPMDKAAAVAATVAVAESTAPVSKAAPSTAPEAGSTVDGKQAAKQEDKPSLLPALASAKTGTGRPGFIPQTMSATARRPSLGLLMRKPSFYFKGAPVVAATTLGLLFMGWAEGVSQNKYMDENLPGSTPPTVIDKEPVAAATKSSGAGPDEQTGGSESAVPPPKGTTPTGGGIFGQGKLGAPSSGGASVSAPGAPAPRAGSVSAPSSGSSGTLALPPAIPQPNVVTGSSRGSNGGGSSGGPDTLNTLPVLRPRSSQSETVRPTGPTVVQGTAPTGSTNDTGGGNTSGSSTQGGMFNPATSPRGYIRIDPVRPVNPVTPVARPGNEARAAENAASRAAAAGRTTDVVPSLNRSIERQATGYTYQRRAMAFMEQGDFSRAADDFQSAIAAYQDQIRQGQNVDDARNGIQTCRSGMNLALSRMTR